MPITIAFAVALLGLSMTPFTAAIVSSAGCTTTTTVTIQPPCAVRPCNICPVNDRRAADVTTKITPIAPGTLPSSALTDTFPTGCPYTATVTTQAPCPTTCITVQCGNARRAPATVHHPCPTQTAWKYIPCPLHICPDSTEVVCEYSDAEAASILGVGASGKMMKKRRGAPKVAREGVQTITETITEVVPTTCTSDVTVTSTFPCPSKCVDTCTTFTTTTLYV